MIDGKWHSGRGMSIWECWLECSIFAVWQHFSFSLHSCVIEDIFLPMWEMCWCWKIDMHEIEKKSIHTEREWRAKAENWQFFIISPFDIISSSFEVWNPTHHHHPSQANEIIFISLHAHNLDEVYFSIIFWLRFSHLNSPHPFLPLLSSSQGVLEYLKLDLFLLPHMISYNLHPTWRV